MSKMEPEMIAPCGMNCRLCMAYIRPTKACEGCHGKDTAKPRHCTDCAIKNCGKRKTDFCYGCEEFPCRALRRLNSRYRKKYHMDMVKNLEYIKKYGMKLFLQEEEKRWTCDACGAVLCVHHDTCPVCHTEVCEWKTLKEEEQA